MLNGGWTFLQPTDATYSLPRTADGERLSAFGPADGGLPTTKAATVDVADVMVAGLRVLEIVSDNELGSINPTGDSIPLTDTLKAVVGPADEKLSLDVINAQFNPFLAQPTNAQGQPVIGRFALAGELYRGKAFISVKEVMQKMAAATGLDSEALKPLIDALSEVAAIHTPAHQFKLPEGPGNRVVFYGDDETAHGDIDWVVASLGVEHMRIAKQMVHFDSVGQGGSLRDIVTDGVGGATHVGGFSHGYRDAAPISIKSDWPTDYGHLDHDNVRYNANLIAIDYQKGVRDTIPPNVLREYKHNADMWDCCAGIIVPFTSDDPDPTHRDYTFNPLEVFDQASARAVAHSLAQLDRTSFLKDHGAFYCAEGQWSVANLGPQEDAYGGTLLKKSRYGDTPLGQLISNFQSAPGYVGMTIDEKHRRPEIGWKYLLALGEDNGGISQEQYAGLVRTDRTGACLAWIPEDVLGWQEYKPLDPEALIARPMTIVTMAWGLMRRYMPRESIAQCVAMDILRAYEAGDDEVKQAAILLCNGHNPTSDYGKIALAVVAVKASTGLLLGLMDSDEFRDKVLEKAGFNEITNEPDKKRVLDEYANFVGVMQDANHGSQAALDAAVLKSDATFGTLIVERSHFDVATGKRVPKRKTLMKYAAPASFGMWAQQPFLAGTGCFRYLATAMHAEQKAISATSAQ